LATQPYTMDNVTKQQSRRNAGVKEYETLLKGIERWQDFQGQNQK